MEVNHNNSNSYSEMFSDQQEIICVSFVVVDFNGNILQKIALTRSAYEPTDGHADIVIVAETECKLLEHLIRILGNKDYNIIMHFNGWAFDEKMIMARMLLYDGLITQYFKAVNLDGVFNPWDISFDSHMKITSTNQAMNMI